MFAIKATLIPSIQMKATIVWPSSHIFYVNFILTWLYWILYAEHGWPVSAPHGFEHFFLAQIGSSILHPDAGLHVIKITAIQLKEINQQEAKVDVRTPRINPRMQL